MNENKAREALSAIGLDDEQIEDVLPLLVEQSRPVVTGGSSAIRDNLTQAIAQEPDWRVRASLAARIISDSLA